MFAHAIQFLIETLFNFYIYIVVLRLILQAMRVRFDNPLTQFAVKLTQPAIASLQKVLPEVKKIDLAILVFALALESIKFVLLLSLAGGSFPRIDGLVVLSMGDLLRHFTSFYFYAIIFRVILSLVVLLRYNPIVFTIVQLTEPLLQPIRRVVPLISGFDLSPVIGLILLELFETVIISGLMQIGARIVQV